MSFERITPEEYFAQKEGTGDTSWAKNYVVGIPSKTSFSILDDKVLIVALTAMVLAFLAFLIYMKGGRRE